MKKTALSIKHTRPVMQSKHHKRRTPVPCVGGDTPTQLSRSFMKTMVHIYRIKGP